MVEYGPFIEYCCETYIHHYVMNIAIAAAIVTCAVLDVAVLALVFFLRQRSCKRTESS